LQENLLEILLQEEIFPEGTKYQGTTLVVPQTGQNNPGL